MNAIWRRGHAYGAVAVGALGAGITNAGQISAGTQADDALAIGVLVDSFYGDVQLQNSGTVNATATGDIASVTAALAHGYNGVVVDNSGSIVAAAHGADATATAVSMESRGSQTLTNSGTIAALGDGTRIAISSTGGAAAALINQGSIIGAIRAGDGDDSLDNAAGATWLAVGESDFGAGVNQIVNHGVIEMDGATVRLGGAEYTSIAAFAVGGSSFDNTGTLVVSGAADVLDLGGTGVMTNNGVISFVDGATDDMLTIVGDLAGQGSINFDVSGLNQASDRLYIDGGVIEPTIQALNVKLTDLPNSASVEIPLVYVAGDSQASDFTLGNVQYDADGFLSMAFRLSSTIDPINATGDVVSLDVVVDGLNGMGSAAAALAPGAQSLVDAQIGTWRQRVGVVPRRGDDAGMAPWIRVFSGDGGVELGHSGNFGLAGDFAFDQANHGWELGLDTRPAEHFAFGVLIVKSDGSQRLTGGAGSDRFDGKTVGLYGTWLADNGLYLDASVRRTEIDARLHSATGVHSAEATADSFNVEAGFTAWTLQGGLNIVPQVQYTHTRVGDITPVHGGSGVDFVGEGGVSSRGRLGVAFDKTFQSMGYTWTPYGSINVVHEFDGEYDYAVNGGLLGTTSTEGTGAMLELGMGASRGGLSLSGGLSWTDGDAQQGAMGGQLVVRYGW